MQALPPRVAGQDPPQRGRTLDLRQPAGKKGLQVAGDADLHALRGQKAAPGAAAFRHQEILVIGGVELIGRDGQRIRLAHQVAEVTELVGPVKG